MPCVHLVCVVCGTASVCSAYDAPLLERQRFRDIAMRDPLPPYISFSARVKAHLLAICFDDIWSNVSSSIKHGTCTAHFAGARGSGSSPSAYVCRCFSAPAMADGSGIWAASWVRSVASVAGKSTSTHRMCGVTLPIDVPRRLTHTTWVLFVFLQSPLI